MTDVRLTATNPEDSSVVPVACNAKGELKLEEPLAFDGNLNGDLSVTGSASFDGDVEAGRINVRNGGSADSAIRTFDADGNQVFRAFGSGGVWIGDAAGAGNIQLNGTGDASFAGMVNGLGLKSSSYLLIDSSSSTASSNLIRANSGLGDDRFTVKTDGSASFSSNVSVGSLYSEFSIRNTRPGGGEVTLGGSDLHALWTKESTVYINYDGKAAFAGGKAGFTAEGHLWCTTVRGDTVILDATSNGMGSWQPYTPPTRREIIEEKVQNIKDAAIKPSQQLPGASEE